MSAPTKWPPDRDGIYWPAAIVWSILGAWCIGLLVCCLILATYAMGMAMAEVWGALT